jgi:hypothetical protein
MKILITESQMDLINESKKKPEVFLGGTCNNSVWRDTLIPKLKIDYFNPVVDDWTVEDAKREIEKRKTCDYVLYVITPAMEGVLSIAEVVDDSHKRPDKTLFSFESKDGQKEFSKAQLKSLEAVKKMVKENGAHVFESLDEIAKFLNK